MAQDKEGSIFDGVNKFFGLGGKKEAPKSKTQAEKDDDVRHRNKFRDGPNDPKPSTKKKDKKAPLKKLKKATDTGAAAKLRDKSKKEMKKQGV